MAERIEALKTLIDKHARQIEGASIVRIMAECSGGSIHLRVIHEPVKPAVDTRVSVHRLGCAP